MYASDTGGYVSYSNPLLPGTLWMGTLLNLYAKIDSVRICPTAPSPVKPTNADVAGNCATAWTWYDAASGTAPAHLYLGSYAINGWLYRLAPGDPDYGAHGTQYYYGKETAVKNTSQTPFFYDSVWVDGWPWETDLPNTDLYDGSGTGSPMMGRLAIPRHGGLNPNTAPKNYPTIKTLPGAINMGFVDGHVGSVKIQNAWHYNWHQNWNMNIVNR